METKEKLNKLKQEYETLNNKLKELSDDEIKTVVGGVVDVVGCSTVHKGSWYTTSIHPDHVLKALNDTEQQLWPGGNNYTFLGVYFAKYWYDGVNAWNHGTCSSVGSEEYNEVDAPTNIYDKFTVDKPF